MSRSITNIEATNPPPESKPSVPSVANLHKPQKETHQQPAQHHHQRGLQEHRLRLTKLLDRIVREQRLGKRQAEVVLHSRNRHKLRALVVHVAAGGRPGQLARRTRAERGVVGYGVRRTRHCWRWLTV